MSRESFQVRQAKKTDCSGILRSLAAAFAPYENQYTAGAFADTVPSLDGLRARIQCMRVLVAISDDEVIGTVAAAVSQAGEGHLRGMAVLPEHRGTGVSARLLTEAETWLQSQGCTRVTLDTTLPLQAAIKFYEKHGYRRSDRVTDFFGMTLLEYAKDFSRA